MPIYGSTYDSNFLMKLKVNWIKFLMKLIRIQIPYEIKSKSLIYGN